VSYIRLFCFSFFTSSLFPFPFFPFYVPMHSLKALRSRVKKFFDLKFPSGLVPGESVSGYKYTVPAIQHVPTNTYMMDSVPIAQFLESTYPDPPVPLTSELGREIEAKARAVVGTAFRTSVLPREMGILSPRAQEYFRRTREASLGHRLEDLLDPEKEEQGWNAVGDGMRAVGELMRTHKADGPFVLGARPSYTDFFITGSLQSARVVDEGVFQRNIKYPGYKEIYEACLPYMEKKD
jgi:glutathione S-transferase